MLVLIGLQSLYSNNPTFGAEFGDYLGLIIWGLGVDVASRTLSNLTSAK
jgi:hypothetical protein